MFKELDVVALTSQIPLEDIWDVPDYSPLLRQNSDQPSGLLPGDTGTIVYVQGGGEAFEVEFVEPGGYTVAIATVKPSQMRLATVEDSAECRFRKKITEPSYQR